jgi:serine/threonine protein kinase
LAYLHGRDIVHGDLKPVWHQFSSYFVVPELTRLSWQKNILIDNAGNAVLADFGQSRILGVSGFTTMTVAGTHRYMAPELLIPENPDASPMSTKASDVWAAGMTGLEVRLQIIVAQALYFDFGA